VKKLLGLACFSELRRLPNGSTLAKVSPTFRLGDDVNRPELRRVNEAAMDVLPNGVLGEPKKIGGLLCGHREIADLLWHLTPLNLSTVVTKCKTKKPPASR
jgi:hypothetical protein